MDEHGTVLVTGGTGTTGREVARLLAAEGWRTRTAARGGADVQFNWTDPATHALALADVDRVYVVAPVAEPDPAALVASFLDRALPSGVRRVVLLSSSATPERTPGLGEVHHLVRTRVPEWAVLCPSWFQQNTTGNHPVARGIAAEGRIVTATGDGRVALVDARDVAAVAVRALVDPESHDTEHLLTGPEALSYDQVATLVSDITGRSVRHEPVGVEEMADRIAASGVPRPFAAALAAMDEGIARGSEERTTDTVHRVTGLPPRSLAALLHEVHAAAPTGSGRA